MRSRPVALTRFGTGSRPCRGTLRPSHSAVAPAGEQEFQLGMDQVRQSCSTYQPELILWEGHERLGWGTCQHMQDPRLGIGLVEEQLGLSC